MSAPTYTLVPKRPLAQPYLATVARLADDVLGTGALSPLVNAYGAFVARTGREKRRSYSEYLLEALALGVLWRSRGPDATDSAPDRKHLVESLVRERRAGCPRRRDASRSGLLAINARYESGRPDPTLSDMERLLEWLFASGEYDEEVVRLDGWVAFLRARPEWADDALAQIVGFSIDFEIRSLQLLGHCTEGVANFLRDELPAHRDREDTVQCSRPRVEYHLNMVGAEILNRAWRDAFLACRRHVVVMSGCMRQRARDCVAERSPVELRCAHCTDGCAVSSTTRLAARAGAEAYAVEHGVGFSRLLRSHRVQGGDVGIVGIACVPSLLAGGWSARAAGLPAQCVLLETSGCGHWRKTPVPTSIDLRELGRILGLTMENGSPMDRGPNVDKCPLADETRRASDKCPAIADEKLRSMVGS